MERLAREYGDMADFFTVWVREAHPGGDFPQPANLDEREQYARAFQASDEPTIRIILDDMEGSLQALMGNMPNSVYIVDTRGIVAYRANWTDAREVERVLARLRLVAERRAAGEGIGMPRWSEETLPALQDDPTQESVDAIRIWEQAKNYEEPERFLGEERAARMRAEYERATGETSIRPE